MNLKNIAMWAIIVFLTIGLYNMFKNPQSNVRGTNNVIFSEFLNSVENGEVLKVEIQGKPASWMTQQRQWLPPMPACPGPWPPSAGKQKYSTLYYGM